MPLRILRTGVVAPRGDGADRQVPIRIPVVQIEHLAPGIDPVSDQRAVRYPTRQETVVPPFVLGREALVGQQHLQDRPPDFRSSRNVVEAAA